MWLLQRCSFKDVQLGMSQALVMYGVAEVSSFGLVKKACLSWGWLECTDVRRACRAGDRINYGVLV